MSSTEKQYGPGLGEGPRYLGIDQSYTGFGLTVLSADGGYETFVRKFEGKGIERLLEIEEWLREKVKRYLGGQDMRYLQNAAIESPLVRTPNALMAGQLFAVVLRVLWLEGAVPAVRRPLQVSPSTLKKYIIGKGAGDKNLVLLSTYKHFGQEFADDNAADSYGLARIAAGMADRKHEREVLDSLRDPKFRG